MAALIVLAALVAIVVIMTLVTRAPAASEAQVAQLELAERRVRYTSVVVDHERKTNHVVREFEREVDQIMKPNDSQSSRY